MLIYRYRARNLSTGEIFKAEVQAQSEQDAFKIIKKEGFDPIEIKLVKGSNSGGLSKYFHRIKSKDRVLFTRQLATLINAGLPIVQSLRSVGLQTSNKDLRLIIGYIVADVEGGSSLSAAISKYPNVFNEVYISLVAAGEASGTLDVALERVAGQQEKDADLISKVRGAMAYPAVVLVVMVGVLTFMLVKVLPQVQILYNGLPGAHLPFITRALLAVSHFVVHYWWVVVVIIVVLIVGGSRWARTFGGRRVIDKLKMRMWPIGRLFMKIYMARFARTAGTLVGSGVPLLQVLEITSKAVSNVYIEDSIRRSIEKVKTGKALSDTLQGDPNFLPLVPNMLRIGEQSGTMEQMLGKTADYYEKEVDNEVKAISTIIEPVMMILLGLVAFTIVAAVLLPIYGLANSPLTQTSTY